MVIRIKERQLSDLISCVSEAMSDRELADTRALFKIGGDELSVSDIPRVQSLSQLSALDRSEWGIGAEGSLVPPNKIFEAARDAGMLFQTDLAARRTEQSGRAFATT